MVISNIYKGADKLLGVSKDREELYKTFNDPAKFELIEAKDYKGYEMDTKLNDRVKTELRRRNHRYQSVFIIFSGHGGKGDRGPFLIANDGEKKDVNEFIDEYKTLIGRDIPKYFLIDACRGSLELPANKGPGDNCFVAYSTEDDHVAKCRQTKGSYWITKVTKQLRDIHESIHISESVVEAIEKANEDLENDKTLKYKQTPYIGENSLALSGHGAQGKYK